MARQVDYYFSLQSPWAYIGHQTLLNLVSTYDLKVNHRPVVLVDLFFGDRRLAPDEAPPGTAALPDGRTAALARQARTEISSAAGELAVQCTPGRWRRDRGARGRPRSRPLFAPGLCRRLGRSTQSRRSRNDRETRRRIGAPRQAIGRALRLGGNQCGV